MAPRPAISQILEWVSAAEGHRDKVEILQKWKSPALLRVLRTALHPQIKWHLVEGDIPYHPFPSTGGEAAGALYHQARLLYLFITGPGEKTNPWAELPTDDIRTKMKKQHKRVEKFIELLESVDPRDARLLLEMRNKKLPYPNITRAHIKSAFPGLLDEVEGYGQDAA